MIFRDQPVRLVGASAEGVHDIRDLLAVAMIGTGDRIMMSDRDQPRAEVDEGEHHALGLKRDGVIAPQRVAQRVRLADRRLRAALASAPE